MKISALGHTWILDLDGSLVKHNGYKLDGEDTFLENAKEFLQSIPEEDMVIFLTSRTEDVKDVTEAFLKKHHVKYHSIIYGAPYGERILINDDKPSGLIMSYAFGKTRDDISFPNYEIDVSL